MPKITRTEFLRLSGLSAGAAFLSKSAFAAGAAQTAQTTQSFSEPDLIVINGRVYTSDQALPRAEAFAVKSGRFVAVGSTSDIRNLATRGTQLIDAGGMTITPGFIDAHCHPSGVNELYGVNLNLRSITQIKDALRKKASETPPGYWVNGFMFDDTKLDDGRPLHRKDLDEAVANHPVNVAHRGGHTNWYNSKAFELAAITRETPDPSDGRFFRDKDGDLSGKVAEHARDVFQRVGKVEVFTPEQRRERARAGMRHISELFTAAGLTTVHDASADRQRVIAYEDAYRNGELRHRVYFMIRGVTMFSMASKQPEFTRALAMSGYA